MSVYLDASVVVATFVEEADSARADRFYASCTDVLVVSDFGAAEVASAVGRRIRAGDVDEDHAMTIFAGFDAWILNSIERIEVTSPDVRSAERFLRRLSVNLRTPDALHIAMALRIDAVLATFDRKLAEAARALSVRVAAI